MKTIHNDLSHRKVYIDFLRIFSIFLVIFNHTGNNGFWLFSLRRDSPFFAFYLFLSVFCKVAVPIYFMVSGAILLGKEEPLAAIVKKRVFKYAGILFVVSLINCVFLNKDMTLVSFLKAVYSTQVTGGLWFLYQYLSFLLALPLLRKLVKNMEAKDYLWLTGTVLLFSGLRMVDLLLFDNGLSYNSNFHSPFLGLIVYYPLMGYFLANKVTIESVSKRSILVCLAASAISIFLCGWMTCMWCNHLGEWQEMTGQDFLNYLIFVPVCFIFLLTRYVFSKIQITPTLEKVITFLSSSTFGIYLFEELYRWHTMPVFTKAVKYLPTIVACALWGLSTFLLGLFVTQVWKFIVKNIRRLLNRENRSQ